MSHSILLVEDHEDTRMMLTTLLSMYGYAVEAAANGREAIDLLANHEFDVVLSDLNMPAMGGEEFYRQLEQRWPHLTRRVVFMTAHQPSARFQADYSRTPVLILRKPFTVDRLREAVACTIARAA